MSYDWDDDEAFRTTTVARTFWRGAIWGAVLEAFLILTVSALLWLIW